MLSLPAFVPPWLRIWLRRLLLLLNMALVAYIMASAEGEGLGLEVAQTWAGVTGLLSQASLLWQLLKRPLPTAEHLSLQCLGIQAACHAARLLGLARWSMQVEDFPMAPLLAALSLLNFGLAAWHRQRLLAGADLEGAAVLGGEAFGAELLRRLQGPRAAAVSRNHGSALLWRALEHAVLPLGALLLGVLVQSALDFGALLTGWRPWAACWHQTLEALALLPQLRVLLALRTPEAAEAPSVAVVPPELAYWLTSTAVGHLLACLTALADAWGPKGAGRQAFAFACGEGFNAAVLGELLLAHFRAKWRGEKRLALPL